MKGQVLIISFWNPTEQNPHQGIFIQDQAAAVCSLTENIIFLQVSILPSKSPILRKEVAEDMFFRNRRITLNIYSLLWKFYYVNPWLLARIINKTILQKSPGIKPELIHSNVIFPCGIVSYLLARKTGSEMIISEHWSRTDRILNHPLFKRIALKAYLNNQFIISVSDFLASKILKGTGHKCISVIPNIVDTGLFSYHQKPAITGKNLTCTCIAKWNLPKRLDLILDSLSAFVRESDWSVHLNIVGNGIQAESFKQQEYPGNLRITWHGYLEKPAIASILWSSQLSLHASETETFSIVTAEALSTGTPVIASNTGALPELVNEHNGILTENNPDSWKESICEIINRRFDYEAIAKANQSKFSPDTVGRAILEVYKKVLNEIE